MDGSFANQVFAQIYIYEKKFADQSEDFKQANISVEVLPKALDEAVASLMVKGFGGIITKLTNEQAEYINVDKSGPFKPDAYKY
jgi:adenosylhomocysteinase